MKKRLDQAVAELRPELSRNQAQAMVMAGQVLVNGQKKDKPGFTIKEDDLIMVNELPRYVGRGALKLESVAEKLGIDFSERVVVDVGASTGGFTDYALQHGAKEVFAVDVGTNQLVGKLRTHPRVVVMEKTDIRKAKLPKKVDIAVIDVSFISVRLILDSVVNHLKRGGRIVVMVKPQFEAGRETANKHRGVIKNDRIRREILKEFEDWAVERFNIEAKADSGVAGSKGNLERFYVLAPRKN